MRLLHLAVRSEGRPHVEVVWQDDTGKVSHLFAYDPVVTPLIDPPGTVRVGGGGGGGFLGGGTVSRSGSYVVGEGGTEVWVG